jgi:serine/threonine protein kinase
MPMSVTLEQFVKQLEDSGIIAGDTLQDFVPPKAAPEDAEDLAKNLVRQKKLTKFQVEEISRGRGRSLTLGSYLLVEKIGEGGMGAVYKAEHRRMKRTVAIKMLPPAMMKSASAAARFQREVEAAAKLRHTNIVAADDADEANGIHFLVMEYVDGSDLSALVKRTGPLPLARAVNYVLQAARGLEFAHKKGVVHRDIKPANLLLDNEETVKILDMGLARIQGDSAGQAELTGSGAVMGTVDYMAPEQALGIKHADARADIYSLGITLWYLLTGKCAYDGETMMAKLLAHRDAPIPSLRGAMPAVPAAVDAVFRKMVAKKLKDRYQSMTEVISDLESCRSGSFSAASAAVCPETSQSQSLSTPKARDALSATSKSTTQPRPATATRATAEATMGSGDALQATDPETRALAGSTAGRPLSAGPAPRKLKSKRKSRPAWWHDRRVQIGGGAAAVLILLAVTVVSLRTQHATLTVELDQPDATVQVLDTEGKVEVSQKEGVGLDDPVFEKWMEDVAAMPAEEQVKAVARKLQERNPRFDGKVTGADMRRPPVIENGVVTEFGFDTDHITDISPVRALSKLRALNCSSVGRAGDIVDLKPLQGMSLTLLLFKDTQVSDLSPLKGMPLTTLYCPLTMVSDLSPLESCRTLQELNVKTTKVTPAAVAALQGALPGCKIEWDRPDADLMGFFNGVIASQRKCGGAIRRVATLLDNCVHNDGADVAALKEAIRAAGETVLPAQRELEATTIPEQGLDLRRLVTATRNWIDAEDKLMQTVLPDAIRLLQEAPSSRKERVDTIAALRRKAADVEYAANLTLAESENAFFKDNRLPVPPQVTSDLAQARAATDAAGGLGLAVSQSRPATAAGADAAVPAALMGGIADALAQRFLPLFNSRDTTGWRTHSKEPGRWRVENGILISPVKEAGSLYTERDDFTNFHLRVEARIDDKGDSGIWFRSPFDPKWPAGSSSRPSTFEAQINSTGERAIRTGSLLVAGRVEQPVRDTSIRPDQWFILEVIAEDNQVVIKVDGTRTARYTDAQRRFPKGCIILQKADQSTTVEFRRVEILEK